MYTNKGISKVKKEKIAMRRIRKSNLSAAQSVFTFYCPCDGSCSKCECRTHNPLSAAASATSISQNNPHEATNI